MEWQTVFKGCGIDGLTEGHGSPLVGLVTPISRFILLVC